MLAPVADAVALVGRAARASARLGPVAGAAAVVLGLVLLVVVGRWRRPIAGVGGTLLGALAALALERLVATRLGLPLPLSAALLAVAGGVGAFLFPVAFPFAAGALPGALLGAHAPLAGRAIFGAAVGGAIGGLVALLFARPVAIGFVSIAGGLLVALGTVGLFAESAFAADAIAHPFAIVALALVAGIAGAAYQLERREPAAGLSGSPVAPRDDA
jgi:hypothetical protein